MPSGISDPVDPQTSALASLRGRLGAHTSWANTVDRSKRTAPARSAHWQKFLDQADGDPVRAEHAWKAHFASLALKSAAARRKARDLTAEAERAEAQLEADGAA